MNETAGLPDILSEEDARHKVESYLLNRYYEFAKVTFDSCELSEPAANKVYRFKGSILIKPRSALDRFIVAKTANTYKFIFEIDAVNGRVINYLFT